MVSSKAKAVKWPVLPHLRPLFRCTQRSSQRHSGGSRLSSRKPKQCCRLVSKALRHISTLPPRGPVPPSAKVTLIMGEPTSSTPTESCTTATSGRLI